MVGFVKSGGLPCRRVQRPGRAFAVLGGGGRIWEGCTGMH